MQMNERATNKAFNYLRSKLFL